MRFFVSESYTANSLKEFNVIAERLYKRGYAQFYYDETYTYFQNIVGKQISIYKKWKGK